MSIISQTAPVQPRFGMDTDGGLMLYSTDQQHLHYLIVKTLRAASPIGAFDRVIGSVVEAEYPDLTADALRCELDVLAGYALIDLDKLPHDKWLAALPADSATSQWIDSEWCYGNH